MAKNTIKITKRDGTQEEFQVEKAVKAVEKAFKAVGEDFLPGIEKGIRNAFMNVEEDLTVEQVQDKLEQLLFYYGCFQVAKAFILYRAERSKVRKFVDEKIAFMHNYASSDNTANATIDDNANVNTHNIAVLNTEIHKPDNREINLGLWERKVKGLYPDFDYKQLRVDLNSIAYGHDLSSQIGMPYCVAISMYPFMRNGLKEIGGLAAAPKNIDSFCGLFVNLVFAIAAQYKGAVATPAALLYMDYFLRKEWGNDYPEHKDTIISSPICNRKVTVQKQIHQYFQQICYSLMQPSGSRGNQACFWNLSIFDKPFYETMYKDFYFPDGTQPVWESFNWLQKEFLHWLNQERLKCILTFPVVSACLIYQNDEFVDQELAEFLANEYSQGNSFFTYISDSADSLSSCCFSKDTKVLWKNSYDGVKCTTLEELHNTKWEPYKKNLKIFHNGSWVKGKSIKLPCRDMYKVTTYNNKTFYMTDNHINVTLNGEKPTSELTTNDYLLFNTQVLNRIPENDEGLTYAEGILVGAFLGDGTISGHICQDGSIHSMNYSLNEEKFRKLVPYLDALKEKYNMHYSLNTPYNNVYPVKVTSKEFVAFIIKWSNWVEHTTAISKDLNLNCLLQSVDFRKGILDGWYITDGGNSNRCYTVSPKLRDAMEMLITSLGMQSIIDVSDRTDENVIIREEVYNRNYTLYCIRFYTPTNHRTCKNPEHSWIRRNNSIYFRIKSIEKVPYEDSVYCIECGDANEPYFTLPSGLITHNCRLSSKIEKPQFNFTNGQLSEMTGSKNVITLNLNRITQDYFRTVDTDYSGASGVLYKDITEEDMQGFKEYLIKILDRIYKYQIAYNAVLMDCYNSGLLTIYNAGFIDMKKQYLTIGINGLNQAAEFLGMSCNKNEAYEKFCNLIFTTIKEQNQLHKTKDLMFNTEFTPCESAAIKLYNQDKKDGYWVPEDTNLYASYIFKPNDSDISTLDKIYLHGRNFCGDNLDGGSSAHLNLDSHLSIEQYRKLLKYAAEVGCKYFTFNVPNCECEECGFIAKQPFDKCPKCGSTKIALWDRVIGYLTKIKNWSKGRQIEQKTRIYAKVR